MQFSLDTVRDVALLLQAAGLHEISVENLDEATGKPFRLTVRRHAATRTAPVSVSGFAAPAALAAAHEGVPGAANGSAVPEETPRTASIMVTATAVGLFRSAKPLLKVGDTVLVGQVVGVVESMKIPNEILAPVSGGIVELQVEDGQGVEYGQPLLTIEPGAV